VATCFHDLTQTGYFGSSKLVLRGRIFEGMFLNNKKVCGGPVERWARLFKVCTVGVVVGGFVAACSPGMFFGGGADKGVLNTARYRKINVDCSKMDLSSSQLSVETFRAALKCFNTYGALNDINKLINGGDGSEGMSDSDLRPIVDAFNSYIINNKRRLFEIDKTHQTLTRLGISQSVYKKLGKILQNGDFIASSIALLKDSYFSVSRNQITKLIQLLSPQVEDQQLHGVFKLGIRVTGAPSFQSLLENFKRATPAESTLEDLVKGIHAYLHEDHLYRSGNEQIPVSRELVQWLRREDSNPFELIDKIYGKDMGEIPQKVALQSALFKVLLGSRDLQNGENRWDSTSPVPLQKLADAVQSLNTSIPCMREGISIPNASMHLFQEISALHPQDASNYILRVGKLALLSMAPFCTYPARLNDHYQVVSDLAMTALYRDGRGSLRTSAMEPMADMIQAVYGSVRHSGSLAGSPGPVPNGVDPLLAQFMIHLFADRGEDSQGGFLRLIPLLKDLADREAWPDLFLVMSLPEQEDRAFLNQNLKVLVKPQEQLGGSTIFDVLMAALKEGKSIQLFNFVRSLKKYVHLEESFLSDSLVSLYQAYQINNVHPVVDLLRDVMEHADQNIELFNTLFKISEKSEFANAIQEMSEIAEDGRLNDLVGAFISLSRRFIGEGVTHNPEIRENDLLPIDLSHRHSLSRRDLPWVRIEKVNDSQSVYQIHPACGRLDLEFSMDQLSDPHYDDHLRDFMDCLGSGSTHSPHQGLISSVQFFRGQKNERGERFFDFQVNLMKNFIEGFSKSNIETLASSWMSAYEDGRVGNFLKALPYWIQGDVGKQTLDGGVLQPLIEVVHPIMTGPTRGHLKPLESFAARVVESDSFPLLLKDMDDLLSKNGEPKTQADINFDQYLPRIRTWVDHKECGDLSMDPARPQLRAAQIEVKARRIVNEAKHLLTDWELVVDPDGPAGSFKPRQSWSVKELRRWLEPIFMKMKHREQSEPDYWILDSMINFFKYFSLKPGELPIQGVHHSPAYLLKWLHERSIDYRPLTYFYPGENEPRIVWDNTLGWLAKTLINTAFPMPTWPHKIMALDFAQEIGEAWGDLPRELWPPQIQKKFSGKTKPMTLMKAVEDILDRRYATTGFPVATENLGVLTWGIGLPQLPPCHRDMEGESPDPQSRGVVGFLPAELGVEKVRELQRYLYNINQVKEVLKENASPGADGSPPGLAVLRDMFFEVYYSTPAAVRNDPLFHPATYGDKNNLSVVLNTARMGMMHVPAIALRGMDLDDPALNDFFNAFIRAAVNPHMRDIMISLVVDDGNQDLFWRVLDQVFEVIDHGSQEDSMSMKQLAYYALAAVGKMDKPHSRESKSDLMTLGLWRLQQVVHEDLPFLIEHAETAKDLLTSARAASFLQAFYEEPQRDRTERIQSVLEDFLSDPLTGQPGESRVKDGMEIFKSIYQDPNARRSFELFKDRWHQLPHLPAYQALKVSDVMQPIVRFFENQSKEGYPLQSPDQLAPSKKIRQFIANLLRNGDLDQFLILMRDQPEGFSQVLNTLSDYAGQGKDGPLHEFLEMVWRSFSESGLTSHCNQSIVFGICHHSTFKH